MRPKKFQLLVGGVREGEPWSRGVEAEEWPQGGSWGGMGQDPWMSTGPTFTVCRAFGVRGRAYVPLSMAVCNKYTTDKMKCNRSIDGVV